MTIVHFLKKFWYRYKMSKTFIRSEGTGIGNREFHCSSIVMNILLSDSTSQIMSFSRECFLHHYGGHIKTVVEQEVGEKIGCKESEKEIRI